MTQPAFINKEVLRWARDRAGLELETVAQGITKQVEKIEAWEDDAVEDRPSLQQARKLADKLRVPFGYLFLSDLPVEELPVPDLRTRRDRPLAAPSPDLFDQLTITMTKQDWYRQYQSSVGIEPLPFVGSTSIDTPAIDAAESIRETLGLTTQQSDTTTWTGFLAEFVRLVERSGVLVMRSGIVGNNTHRPLSANEFQGFALSDPIAPLVFLNSKDFVTARIFTLAHELAHIWAGQSGISLLDPAELTPGAALRIETWCNTVAAETLVPETQFLRAWANRDVDTNVQNISKRFKVSTLVVLRRAMDLRLINRRSFFRQLEIEQGRHTAPSSGGGGGINTLLARNSRTFTQALVSSAAEGRVGYSEACRLLGVKVGTIHKLASQLVGVQ